MTFPVVIDEPATRPGAGPTPGAVALQAHLTDKFGGTNLGIYNPRDICGNPWPLWKCAPSTHAEGRSGDTGFPVVEPGGHPNGTACATWLVNHAEALGVQRIIWAGRSWNCIDRVWKPYTGRYRHFDHVHWELNRAAASALTVAVIEALETPMIPKFAEKAVFWARAHRLIGDGDVNAPLTKAQAVTILLRFAKLFAPATQKKLGVDKIELD